MIYLENKSDYLPYGKWFIVNLSLITSLSHTQVFEGDLRRTGNGNVISWNSRAPLTWMSDYAFSLNGILLGWRNGKTKPKLRIRVWNINSRIVVCFSLVLSFIFHHSFFFSFSFPRIPTHLSQSVFLLSLSFYSFPSFVILCVNF